jgi:hypothetical protein
VPHGGAQHAPAVEREGGQQIEDARIRLMKRQIAEDRAELRLEAERSDRHQRNMAAARRKLAMGPAIAIQNSAAAVLGSSSISATPPKMNSVMREIGRS